MTRSIVAEFHKRAGGRLTLFSLVAIFDEKGDGHFGREFFDVDYSRAYGYIFHMSGFGGGDEAESVEGPYFISGDVKVVEKPTQLVDVNDKPPWRSKKTRAIRERNRTRRLRELPKQFVLANGQDLLNWLENNGIDGEAVYCSKCRDYFPGDSLCEHCWWCDRGCDYSTPANRCKCADEGKKCRVLNRLQCVY